MQDNNFGKMGTLFILYLALYQNRKESLRYYNRWRNLSALTSPLYLLLALTD